METTKVPVRDRTSSSRSKTLNKPNLPQADANGVVDDWHWNLGDEGDIVVNVDQVEGSYTAGDIITVYFGDKTSQWEVSPYSNPPANLPYSFNFKAGGLPDGLYKVYYRVLKPSGDYSDSPSTSITIVNSPDRQGVVVSHIESTIPTNYADPGSPDKILTVVYDTNNNPLQNAWVAFYGPEDATIDPPVIKTDDQGQAECSVIYPRKQTIEVNIWCGRVLKRANPTFGKLAGYSLGLVPADGDTTAYGDGSGKHKAKALLEYESQLVDDPDKQALVNFTLPTDKSAIFVDGPDVQNYSEKLIQVMTQGGIASASFTDSNEAGKTVSLNAQVTNLAPAPPLPFTFKPVWDLELAKITDNQPPDGHTPDVGQVSVIREGKQAPDNTHVQFTLNKTTATFLDKDPNILEWYPQKIIVKTSGGAAKAWFVDNNPDGEQAVLTASLPDHTDINSVTKIFSFASAHNHELDISIKTNDSPADSLSQNEVNANLTDSGSPSTGTIIFELEGSNNANFVDTGDPNIAQISDKEIWVKTGPKGVAKAYFVDSNTSGENVTVTASLQGLPSLKPSPSSLSFTFSSVDTGRGLFLFPLSKAASADSTQQNKCLALLTELLIPTDGTIVFTLPKDKSASFVNPKDSQTTYVGPKEIKVKTQNGLASALFTDSDADGETVVLEARSETAKPSKQPFLFNPAGTAPVYEVKLFSVPFPVQMTLLSAAVTCSADSKEDVWVRFSIEDNPKVSIFPLNTDTDKYKLIPGQGVEAKIMKNNMNLDITYPVFAAYLQDLKTMTDVLPVKVTAAVVGHEDQAHDTQTILILPLDTDFQSEDLN